MSMAKMLNRFRRALAKALDAKPTLPTRASHRAYPETQLDDDGSWIVRFYAYEPFAWRHHGETHATRPPFPEPTLAHPSTYAEGQAPAENQIAWRAYYAGRPQAITLLEEFTGKAANRGAAQAAAYRALRARLPHYRREL